MGTRHNSHLVSSNPIYKVEYQHLSTLSDTRKTRYHPIKSNLIPRSKSFLLSHIRFERCSEDIVTRGTITLSDSNIQQRLMMRCITTSERERSCDKDHDANQKHELLACGFPFSPNVSLFARWRLTGDPSYRCNRTRGRRRASRIARLGSAADRADPCGGIRLNAAPNAEHRALSPCGGMQCNFIPHFGRHRGRRCPPEDVGGAHGYQEFIEAIPDTTHESFDQHRAWHGLSFHGENLNLGAANRKILRKRWPAKYRRGMRSGCSPKRIADEVRAIVYCMEDSCSGGRI
jgi:hypothetical protein